MYWNLDSIHQLKAEKAKKAEKNLSSYEIPYWEMLVYSNLQSTGLFTHILYNLWTYFWNVLLTSTLNTFLLLWTKQF